LPLIAETARHSTDRDRKSTIVKNGVVTDD
jgi:hypothetical protein